MVAGSGQDRRRCLGRSSRSAIDLGTARIDSSRSSSDRGRGRVGRRRNSSVLTRGIGMTAYRAAGDLEELVKADDTLGTTGPALQALMEDGALGMECAGRVMVIRFFVRLFASSMCADGHGWL